MPTTMLYCSFIIHFNPRERQVFSPQVQNTFLFIYLHLFSSDYDCQGLHILYSTQHIVNSQQIKGTTDKPTLKNMNIILWYFKQTFSNLCKFVFHSPVFEKYVFQYFTTMLSFSIVSGSIKVISAPYPERQPKNICIKY